MCQALALREAQGAGGARRGTRKRTHTEKGQAYSPKPKSCRVNKDSPAIQPRKASTRGKKANRLKACAKARASRSRACQTLEGDEIGTFLYCLSTLYALSPQTH
jgi:hypothetical protein